MESCVECRILGPLDCSAGGRTLPVGAARHRKVLIRLALDAGRTVALPDLVAAVWDDHPPRRAERMVRNSVSDLRTTWSRAGLRDPTQVIITTGCGYLLRIAPTGLDTDQFRRLVDLADLAVVDGHLGHARDQLRSALSLWRGPPCAGLPGRVFEAAATCWHELRLATWERCTALELALGRYRSLVPELLGLAAEHPYREGITAQLMLALYRSGRQAEALAVYRRLRQHLANDLGVDPDPLLQDLHAAILRRDPGVDLAALYW